MYSNQVSTGSIQCSCFNTSFKNILKDSEEDPDEYYLKKSFETEEIDLMIQQNSIVSDDIKIILNVLRTFESVEGEEVLGVLNEWKQTCIEARNQIVEEGMIDFGL